MSRQGLPVCRTQIEMMFCAVGATLNYTLITALLAGSP
jgi:hypothetical protein